MSGVKGKSGRLPLKEDILRYQVRQRAYEVTQEYLDSKGKLKERAVIAVQVVKSDMAKPIVIDQSKHTHLTTVEFKNMKDDEIIDFLTGRQNGITSKSA